MTEKELTIQKYMEKLGLTLEEAEELYADEQADNLPELSAEQKSVVREMTQAARKKETTPRNRERKIDENKRFLIRLLAHTLSDHDDERFGELPSITITNPERQIDFVFNGEKYRFVLSKPRKN
jgi:DNA-binding transcriptional MerR regulator